MINLSMECWNFARLEGKTVAKIELKVSFERENKEEMALREEFQDFMSQYLDKMNAHNEKLKSDVQ